MFRSAHSALTWACPVVKMSGINRMRKESARGMPNETIVGLSVHEQHAQAAAIIGMAERLDDPSCWQGIHCRQVWAE